MRIPIAEILIPRNKLTQYLLILRLEDDKSKFLAQAGFTLKNPDALEQAIRQLIQDNDAVQEQANEFGEYYRVTGELIGVNGRILDVVTIWIIKTNKQGKFSFVTLIPLKE